MNAEAATYPREATVDMAPPRDKAVDVERLTFPLPMVLAMLAAIATTAFAVGGAQYLMSGVDRKAQADMQTIQAQMQSDIRDMRTRMESQSDLHKLEKDLLDAQLAAMKATIENATNRAAALSMASDLSRAQAAQRNR